MKNTIKALKFSTAFLLVLSSFIACDKDFSIIESDVLGKGNANFTIDSLNIPITAYNKKLGPLRINNLNSNLFGVFDDPEFGRTTASIIAQITPSSFDPSFGVNPVIDSVILTIPYFSRITGLDDDGNTEYTIQDSLYGDSSNEVKLTIYRNNYFLRSFNPNSTNSAQSYFSHANSGINTTDNFALIENNVVNFDDHKGNSMLDIEFTPSSDATKTTVGEDDEAVTTRSDPAFREHLDIPFWTTAIIDQEGTSVLSNSSNFNDYFRGLYFKAEAIDGEGNMVLLNFASASIVMYFTNGEDDARIQSTYSFSFSGNILNTFINEYNIPLENGDSNLGDETIYLKGTEGSMAIVDLFGSDEDALEDFKRDFRATDESGDYIMDDTTGDYVLKRLINEAQLVIYENELLTTSSDEDYHRYDRIYAYDIKNNTPIIDYFVDPTTGDTSNPLSSVLFHLSQRDTIQKKYKVRLTEHLNNILLKDSMNTKIGLTLSTNVNITTQAEILEKSEDDVTAIPEAAILTPRGTILHGSNENVVPSEKRMELQVFFTKPEND